MYIDVEKSFGVEHEECVRHEQLRCQLEKTLYLGTEVPLSGKSKPLQDISVRFLRQSAPRELGKLDEEIAANISRCRSVSACSLMLGLVFVERMRQSNPEYLAQISSSDLFLVSMLVAAKYLHDDGTSEQSYNDDWADDLDRETTEINELEREFLRALDWRLYIKNKDFMEKVAKIESALARHEIRDRGCTYTELAVLMSDSRFIQAATSALLDAVKVVSALSATLVLYQSIVYASSVCSLFMLTTALHAYLPGTPITSASSPVLGRYPLQLSSADTNQVNIAALPAMDDVHVPTEPIVDEVDTVHVAHGRTSVLQDIRSSILYLPVLFGSLLHNQDNSSSHTRCVPGQLKSCVMHSLPFNQTNNTGDHWTSYEVMRDAVNGKSSHDRLSQMSRGDFNLLSSTLVNQVPPETRTVPKDTMQTNFDAPGLLSFSTRLM